MDELWWYETTDAYRMLEALWRQPHRDVRILKYNLHRYYLACCRAIWELIPDEDIRWGIEIGEQYLVGEIDAKELNRINYYVEGAAFNIDYNCDPEAIEQWVDQLRSMPKQHLRVLLHSHETNWDIEPRELLKRAAYFADFAMMYSELLTGGVPPESYAPFLSAKLLRQFVGNPFRSECCTRT